MKLLLSLFLSISTLYSQNQINKVYYGGFEVGKLYTVNDTHFRFYLDAKKFCKKDQLNKSLEIYDTWHFNYGVKKQEDFKQAFNLRSKQNTQDLVQQFKKFESFHPKSTYKYWFPKDNIFELDQSESLDNINVYIAKQIKRGDQDINDTCFSILFNQRQEAYLKRKSRSNDWSIKRGKL
ncbi:MAG: hypothetical protein KC646_00670 [Candidatus Cloacimonetes bacterium]|nr:hypothetical protein [Candidatus Cloacimonadota bacterium]